MQMVATSPFQPPRPSNSGIANPNIPFMPFDIRSASVALWFAAPIFAPFSVSLFVSDSFEDELPLLEELN